MTDDIALATALERGRIASFVEDVLGADPADDETAAEELAEAFNARRDASIEERWRAMSLLLVSMIRNGRHVAGTEAFPSRATTPTGPSEALGAILEKSRENLESSQDADGASDAIRRDLRETIGTTDMDGILAELLVLHLDVDENDRWRSMESAPRDWTDLILFDPTRDEPVFEGYYSCAEGGADCWMSASNQRVNPVMWRRRPKAPTAPARIERQGDV